MVLIWLRHYPTNTVLAAMFGTNTSTVTRIIRSTIPIMYHHLKHFVSWPTAQEWSLMQKTWEMFPTAVGCIDGTLHKINRPTENQQLFYSGHRHFHGMSTQVIVDVHRNIRYVKSGFQGSANDAGQFLHLPSIGPGKELDFPPDCCLLGDKAYANRYPVITPFRRNQIGAGLDGDIQLIFNIELARHRVIIEHTISYI